jgi:hypothetical protein
VKRLFVNEEERNVMVRVLGVAEGFGRLKMFGGRFSIISLRAAVKRFSLIA